MCFSSDSKDPTHQNKADLSTDPSPWFHSLERERIFDSEQDDVDLILTISNLVLATESETGKKIVNVDTVFSKVPRKSLWLN